MRTLTLALAALLGGCAAPLRPEPQEVWVIVQSGGSVVRAPLPLNRPVRVVQVVVEPVGTRR